MEKTRIVITGVSVISPLGADKDVFWKNLTEGVSGIKPVTLFDVSKFNSKQAGEISDFDAKIYLGQKGIRHIDRTSLLVSSGTVLAIKDANLENNTYSGDELGIVVGSTYGSIDSISSFDFQSLREGPSYVNPMDFPNTVLNAPASRASIFCKATGLNTTISNGVTSGIDAIIYASDFLRMGRVKAAVVGGVHGLTHDIFWGSHNSKILAGSKNGTQEICAPFDKRRNGMIIGEASALVILETLEDALKRNAHIYAEILGYGLSCDAQHMTLPSVEGVSGCMVKAMRESGITSDDVDYISAHGTGTPSNDRTECASIKNVFGQRYKQISVSSIKSMLGHTMGAASALEAITCALAIKNDVIPPTINFETPDPECDIDCVPNQTRRHTVNIALNNSYAFGGNNASVVLKKFI